MKFDVGKVLEHPIATVFIVGAITNGISGIIRSAKGTQTAIKPATVNVSVSKPDEN